MPEKDKESLAANTNAVAAFSYVLGFISGIVVLAMKKKDEYIHFHAVQSIGLSVVWVVGWLFLTVVPVLGWILLPFWGLIMFVTWLVSIVKAFQGERFELPIVGAVMQKVGKQLGL